MEVCLNAEEVLQSSDDELASQLENLTGLLRGQPATVRADGFQVHYGLEADLATIRRWTTLARRMTRVEGVRL